MNTTSAIPIITNIKKMQPGKAIKMSYTASAGAYGTFSLEVNSNASEISPSGSVSTPNGYFYFVCVGYTNNGKLKLVADRVIQTNITWDTLSNAGLCTADGKTIALDQNKYANCQIRIPLGSSSSTLDLTNENELNEWDALISLDNDINDAVQGESDFWNISGVKTWVANTPIGAMGNRVTRGQDVESNAVTQTNKASTYSGTDVGFRPILIIPDLLDTTPSATDLTYPTCELELVRVAAAAKPGKALKCLYQALTAGAAGNFYSLGTAVGDEISDRPPSDPNGIFCFVCVGYEPSGALKFVADRVIQSNISWETLNTAGYCTMSGKDVSALTGVDGSYIRLMSSSVVTNSQSKLSSEWDAIIFKDTVGQSNVPTSKINDWNYSKTKSWMLETPSITDDLGNAPDMSYRIVRGQEDKNYGAVVKRSSSSSFSSSAIGFRPVLIVPVNTQNVVMEEERITPTHVYKRNAEMYNKFIIIDEEATIADVTFEYFINDTPLFEGPIHPLTTEMTVTIPYDKLQAGNNIVSITVRCLDKNKVFKYNVVKEVPGDTTRSRDYKSYSGGFNLNNLSFSNNTVAGAKFVDDYSTTTSLRLPSKLLKIEIKE